MASIAAPATSTAHSKTEANSWTPPQTSKEYPKKKSNVKAAPDQTRISGATARNATQDLASKKKDTQPATNVPVSKAHASNTKT